MVDIITTGTSIISPTLLLEFESSRAGGTVIHRAVNRSAPDATLRPAGLRVGRMVLGFAGATSEAESFAAESLLASAAVFALVSSDRATIQVQFVIPESGSIARALEDETRNAWLLTFDWVEVSP